MTQRKLAETLLDNLDVVIDKYDRTMKEICEKPRATCLICVNNAEDCFWRREECIEGIRQWLMEQNKSKEAK